MRKMLLIIIFMIIACDAFSQEVEDKKYKGNNNFWSNFWSYSATYKLLYDTYKFANVDDLCDKDSDKHMSAGRGSVFYVNQRANNDSYYIIDFEDINVIDKSSVEKYKPYKLCKNNETIPSFSYKRTGGIITGLLVVPFKYRTGGELSGDAAIGPYVGVSGERFSVIASLGLSQIAVSDINSKEIENRTGITAAAGINWTVASNFDIAFLAGVDHLSGSAADNFKYQDKVWGSFAVGYNFTR